MRNYINAHCQNFSLSALPLVVNFQLRAPLLVLHFSQVWWEQPVSSTLNLKACWMYEETISPALASLNKTGLSLVFLSRKALDLHGHRLTHSPEGDRTVFLYLICSCWGFYTCVLDNWPRHCHSKKALIWNKRLKAPRRIVRQLCRPTYSPGFLYLFLFFVYIYLPFWHPQDCAVIHITAGARRGSGGEQQALGLTPQDRQPHFFCDWALWDDLIQTQHVQHALSVV